LRCLTWCHSEAFNVQLGTAQSNSEADTIAVRVVGIGTPSTFTIAFFKLPFLKIILPSLFGLNNSTLVLPVSSGIDKFLPYLLNAQEADFFLCLCAMVKAALILIVVQNLSRTDFMVLAE
jgi:hypothetical protein